ncbi:GLUG motif-containing protein [Chloroflexota bacterium]
MSINLKRKGLAFGIILLLVSAILFSISLIVSADSPTGTAIYDCDDLQDMNNNLSGDYYLANDIDCSETDTWNGGEGFIPIGGDTPFTGRFDGQGYEIANLYINRPDDYDQGLFGYLESGAKVKNVGLLNATVTGEDHVGGIAGSSGAANISCCYVESSNITGTLNSVGGVVGDNYGTIYNCYFTGTINGNSSLGGIAGRNSCNIYLCYTEETATVNGYDRTGGLVGYNNGGDILLSWSDGTVNCSVEGAGHAGGLVGQSVGGSAYIANCYSMADVYGRPDSAYSDIGGLIGTLGGGGFSTEVVYNCYSTGLVDEGYVEGGLVGDNAGGTIINSFWDTDTSGQTTSGGGTGLGTTDMKKQTTFESAGWDFITTWQIDENVSYPYFKVQAVCTIGWPTINSEWIDAPPIIDGNFPDGEWTNHQLLIEDPIHTYVYFKNDASFLYVCVDAANTILGDYTEDDDDYCDLVFDTGNDETWTEGDEDYFQIRGDGGKMHLIATGADFNWTHHCDFDAHPGLEGVVGFGASPNAATDHRIYEFKIPMSLLGASPGDTIGFSSWDSIPYDDNGGSDGKDDIWPPGVLMQDLSTWGNLVLYDMQPEPSPTPHPVGAVGGEAYPVNKVGLIAPWIALGTVIGIGGLYLNRRRVHN